MASLTQTAQGDLTSFIAGKIFERVKESLDKREIPKGSPEVEKAIKKFEEEEEGDVTSIPVVDEKLRRQVVKLFGAGLEIKLVQMEGKIEKTNAAIKTIGGTVSDTQELIVNQNQILEDKFDKLLEVLGVQVEEEKKNKDKLQGDKVGADIFDQNQQFGSQPLDKNFQKGMDFAKGGGFIGYMLRKLGIKHGSRLFKSFTKRFIPKGIRSRARLVRKIPGSVRRKAIRSVVTRVAGREIGDQIVKQGVKKGSRYGAKFLSKKTPALAWVPGTIFAIERALKGDAEGAILEFASGVLGSIPGKGTAASAAIDGYLFGRDINRGYSAGTNRTKKGLAELHGREAILGRKDIKELALGYNNAIGLIGAALTSVPLDIASAVGAESDVKSLLTDEGLAIFDRGPSYAVSAGLGKPRSTNSDVKAIDQITEFKLPVLNARKTDEKKKKPWWDPRGWFDGWFRGGSGSSIIKNNQSLIDASGEPGVDFTPTGIDNRALFDGEVVEIGYQFNPKTQRGYGNYVVVRSEDPVNGEQFDALYAHIPKNAIYVNKGDQLKVGDKIGRMGTEDDDITDIGSINGTHMSVDFLKVGSSEPYPHWRTNIVPLVDTKFSTAKLKSKNFNPDLKTTTMKMLGAYENIKLEAYDDGTGVWTIGFGATRIRDKETGKMRDVRPGDTITEKEAFAMKDADYIRHYNIAEKELNAQGLSLSDLPVNVAAPLISLAFNYGSLRGAHKGSTSKWMINGKEVTFPNSLPVMVKNAYATGDYSKIADLLEFNLSQDMPDLPGLGERRKSEAQIIRSGSGTGYYNLQDLDLLPPSPPSTKNLLTSKLDYDSKEVEELFDKINTAGQPIILLNTQVIANNTQSSGVSKGSSTVDWKNHYRLASLG